MTTLANVAAAIVIAVPFLERILMRVFESYMRQKHKVEVAKFVDAEAKARKTSSTKDLQNILGKRLR